MTNKELRILDRIDDIKDGLAALDIALDALRTPEDEFKLIEYIERKLMDSVKQLREAITGGADNE